MMSVATAVEELSEKILFREQQIETLLLLMGQKCQTSVSSIFAYGPPCTGKSLVITSILKHHQLPHVLIDCVECFQSRIMYEHILNTLSGQPPSEENDFTVQLKCDNINSFVRMLRHVVNSSDLHQQTVYLVFARAERLRDMDLTILPALLNLKQLSGLNVTTVLESSIVWEKFRSGTGFSEPYLVLFPAYTKEETCKILELDKPAGCSDEFYKSYINVILSVFLMPCQNLKELHYLAQLHWSKYLEPVQSGEADPEDKAKLWRKLQPHLKTAMQTVYLREVSSSQWEKMLDSEDNGAYEGLSKQHQGKLELPYYSKFLLISAYLCSYNPASTDKRFFSKRAPKTSKRQNLASQKKKDERTSGHMLGPKPFPLDRMMAIFYTVVEDHVVASANIFSQVSSLVTLGLLSHLGGSDTLEAPKYKCLVSLDLIKQVAKSVDFDIKNHLYDFASLG